MGMFERRSAMHYKLTRKMISGILFRGLLSPVFWIVVVFSNRRIILDCLNSVYQDYLDFFNPPVDIFAGTLPYIYVGVAAILATVLSILISSEVSRQNQRRQNTVNLLLESRTSHNYGMLMEADRNYFPKINDNTVKTYQTYIRDLRGAGKRREGARAVFQLLNYFEFLSAGILHRSFDEPMMEETIRGILCGRVYDMRFIIQEVRKQRPKSYENLVAVYWRWFNEETDKPLPKRLNLGPSPSVLLMKFHKLVLKLPPFI